MGSGSGNPHAGWLKYLRMESPQLPFHRYSGITTRILPVSLIDKGKLMSLLVPHDVRIKNTNKKDITNILFMTLLLNYAAKITFFFKQHNFFIITYFFNI